jgi:hypothetical protein
MSVHWKRRLRERKKQIMNLNEWNKNPLRTKKEKYKCHYSNLDWQPNLGVRQWGGFPIEKGKKILLNKVLAYSVFGNWNRAILRTTTISPGCCACFESKYLHCWIFPTECICFPTKRIGLHESLVDKSGLSCFTYEDMRLQWSRHDVGRCDLGEVLNTCSKNKLCSACLHPF